MVGSLTVAPHASFMLGYFYRQGAQYLDAGFLAWLIGGSGIALPIPTQLGGGSYYGTHLVPLFSVLSACLRHAPTSTAEDFAIFTGVMNAMPAIAVYWMLVGPLGWRDTRNSVFAAALAIGFGFSGFILQSMRYPHFETLIEGALMLFLVALVAGRTRLASGFFILALITREDAGLHAALALLGVLMLQRRSPRFAGGWRVTLGFMMVGLIYAAAGLTVQHWLFPGQGSFARVYLGTPPFAGVSAESIATRLLGYSLYRSYVILPAVVAFVWALRRRNVDVALGFILCLPWLALHLIAVIPLAATLSGYYGFPFLLAMFWPLLALSAMSTGDLGAAPIERRRRELFSGFAAILVASWIAPGVPYNPSHLDLFASYVSWPPGRAERHRLDLGIARLRQLSSFLGKTGADGAVMSLAPNGFGATVWLDPSRPQEKVAAIYYFAGSSHEAFATSRAEAAHFDRVYAVGVTPLRVATDRDLSGLPVTGLRLVTAR